MLGTGQNCRDFVHVSDVVAALIQLGERKDVNGEVYNLGLGKTTSVLELADMILKILNLQNRTKVTTTGVSWQGDVTKIWFDITKAKEELGWTPKVTLEESIKKSSPTGR
jgi:nucleoside-diphosphate-sugar epimerase